MKVIVFFAAILLAAAGRSQSIKSDVYQWKNLPVDKKETSERRAILDGKGAVLPNMEVHASTLWPKTGPQPKHIHQEDVMVIIKEGKLKVTIGDKSKTMGPGSIAYAISGDELGVENAGDSKVTYYIMKFRSDSVNVQRGKEAGGSFFTDWNDIEFKPHDKGGVRQYFNRPTAALKRLDIHVSSLNAGLKSHDPHTHKVEEIVLMIEGNAEMQIGDAVKKASTGDLIYLESMIPHAIKNDDIKPIMYYAIQWE
jgi:(S)-ureidoglycine aminohydrolase